jgi:probable HAF family extracellular repeat protein
MRNLGSLAGAAYALTFGGLNNLGQVVGDSGPDAFVWDSVNGMRKLPLPENSASAAYGINDAGQIAGYFDDMRDGLCHGFLWDNGEMTDLGTLHDRSNVVPYAINNQGQIVGTVFRLDDHYGSGFIWDRASGMRAMPVDGSYFDINDSGQVACGAVLWDSLNDVLVPLGTLPGETSTALGINNNGQVVGWSSAMVDQGHPFVWDAANGIQVLRSLDGPESWAWGINDSGQIAGWVRTDNGDQFAILWTPVPEPSSLLALLCGLGGMAGIIRYRRR